MGGEILNADSMQIYRYLDIGTAKPTLSEQKEVPYHLIDIIDPDQPFDASEFRIRAQSVIEKLHLRRVPILVVGGTGLYLRVLQRGIFPCPKPKAEIRMRWQQAASEHGPQFLWSALKEADPQGRRTYSSPGFLSIDPGTGSAGADRSAYFGMAAVGARSRF